MILKNSTVVDKQTISFSIWTIKIIPQFDKKISEKLTGMRTGNPKIEKRWSFKLYTNSWHRTWLQIKHDALSKQNSSKK